MLALNPHSKMLLLKCGAISELYIILRVYFGKESVLTWPCHDNHYLQDLVDRSNFLQFFWARMHEGWIKVKRGSIGPIHGLLSAFNFRSKFVCASPG